MDYEAPLDVSASPHRPIHWYADRECYWLTGATLHHDPHLREDGRKACFVREFLAAADRWLIEPVGWTLMEHHYHAIVWCQEGRSLPRFLARLHTKTSTYCNRLDDTPG